MSKAHLVREFLSEVKEKNPFERDLLSMVLSLDLSFIMRLQDMIRMHSKKEILEAIFRNDINTKFYLDLLSNLNTPLPLSEEVVKKGLSSSSLEIRDSTMSFIEHRGEESLLDLLSSHMEEVPYLKNYQQDILKDFNKG